MEKLTEEEFKFLEQFEDRINSAHISAYAKTMNSSVVHRMREIYSRLIGKWHQMNENCGSCVLTLLRKLYAPYYEYKQTIERNSARCTNESEQNTSNASGGKEQNADTRPDN